MVDQTRIFDKFVRLKPDERQMGAGLGLTITSNIAQLMQGVVSVESPLSEARGSSFSLRFPVPHDAVVSVMLCVANHRFLWWMMNARFNNKPRV